MICAGHCFHLFDKQDVVVCCHCKQVWKGADERAKEKVGDALTFLFYVAAETGADVTVQIGEVNAENYKGILACIEAMIQEIINV